MPDLVKKHLDPLFIAETRTTKGPGHATRIVSEYLSRHHPDLVIAVGGDGTVNETAGPLIHHSAALGIIPTGSGNGLARFMGLPMNPVKAIQRLNNARILEIDVGQVNGRNFICTAGIGFDAHIGKLFASGTKRGLWGYTELVIREYMQYHPREYSIRTNGKSHTRKAFLITIANAGQYGNNAYISPHALINDGFLELCTLAPFPKLQAPELGIRLFTRSMHKSRFFDSARITRATIRLPGDIDFHLDGEHLRTRDFLEISILPQALRLAT